MLPRMKKILANAVASVVYVVFRYINDTIMEILVGHIKQFNIIGIANLENDVMYLFDFCYSNIMNEYEGNRTKKVTNCIGLRDRKSVV